jgi:hypothetical protein
VQTSIDPDQDVYLVQELLEPALSLVMIERIALRERMPTYLRHRQAVLESRRLIYPFEGPFTAEESGQRKASLSSLLNTGIDDIQARPHLPTRVTLGAHAADTIIIRSNFIPILPIYASFPWSGFNEPFSFN